MTTTTIHRLIAIALSIAAAGVLFLAADYLVSARILPEPNTPIELVKAVERPFRQGADGWYDLKPDFRGRFAWGDGIYDVRTDAFGFRADEERGDKAGQASVIVLGDSFAYGMNGPWSETFVGMYDRSVDARIANAAVPSYSPTPYLHRYKQALAAGALRRPHVVVIALDVSDVHDEAGVWIDGDEHPKNLRAINNDMSLVGAQRGAVAATAAGRLRDRLRFTGSIYQYLRYSVLGIPNRGVFDQIKSSFTWNDWRRLDETPAAITGFSPLGVAGGLARIAAKVEAIVQLAHSTQSTVLVLIYPWPAQLQHDDRFSWSAYVSDTCKRASCDGVIDTIPAFRAYAQSHSNWYRALYVSGDVHFNREGNAMIASALAEALR